MHISNYKVSMQSEHNEFTFNSTQRKNLNNNFSDILSPEKIEEQIVSNNKKNAALEREKLLFQLNMVFLSKISKFKQKITIGSNSKKLNLESFHFEKEELKLQTKAYIKTPQKEFKIDIEINLKRSFLSHNKLDFSNNFDLLDPLVLSLDSQFPTLSEEKFYFDIDSDGDKEQISKLGKNSAFLAFDRNNNGKIDDGNELFGTKSGNGFSDLKMYDKDRNNWIDENDEIFHKLRIWKKTKSENKLIALGEVGIGAIYLDNTNSSFNVKSNDNTLLGKAKNSSFFLFENGKASITSQIDLALKKQ